MDIFHQWSPFHGSNVPLTSSSVINPDAVIREQHVTEHKGKRGIQSLPQSNQKERSS
jgi:hypothetical protein